MSLISFLQRNKRRIKLCISLPARDEFARDSEKVESFLSKIERSGATVCRSISAESLADATKYDVLVFIAHHEIDSNSLETTNGLLPTADFVSMIPEKFAGVIDLSCCYSAEMMQAIKQRCPDCHVQATIQQTTLLFRLAIYPSIFEEFLKNRIKGYHEICKRTIEDALNIIKNRGFSGTNVDSTTKLGRHASSVFAPSKVKKEEPFMIQFFFHPEENGEDACLMARRMDPETGLIDNQTLPLRLKIRDRIAVALSIITPEKENITIDQDTKEIIWFNATTKLQFAVTVNSRFTLSKLLVSAQIEVNRMPVGSCMFNIAVEDKQNEIPAFVSIQPYNAIAEHKNTAEETRIRLNNQRESLIERIKRSVDENEKRLLINDLQVCEGCLDLFNTVPDMAPNEIKRAFISSTSDLSEFRDIIRREVEAFGLYPEMYENWQQTIGSPRDICCKKVLDSDLYIAIFGERYGFIEPAWNMSMTEIEYRTALSAGKQILVFVLQPPVQNYFEPRQRDFIESVRSARILKFFEDSNSLSTLVQRDLSKIK